MRGLSHICPRGDPGLAPPTPTQAKSGIEWATRAKPGLSGPPEPTGARGGAPGSTHPDSRGRLSPRKSCWGGEGRCILNHMVQYREPVLDASFAALSDVTRRGVLEQLVRADASITELAERFHMTLTGMKKHVGVLEQAGLVTTEKVGRVRTCKLGLRGMEKEAEWIERYRQLWAARFQELDKLVEELKHQEKTHGQKKR